MYNNIDLSQIDLSATVPADETQRQYYYMAKARTYVDKLAVENEQLKKANGGNAAAPAMEPPPNDGEETRTEDEDADPDEE